MNSRTIRSGHRLAGCALSLPLCVWMTTGILFHVKHRYAEAYEALALPPPAADVWSRAALSPADAIGRGLLDAGPVTLGSHPEGEPVYFGRREGRPVAVSAVDGRSLAPAALETGRSWAEAAVAASPNRARYGRLLGTEPAEHPSARTGASDPAVLCRYEHKRVTVDLLTGELTQTGALNDFIDLTYRLHYLQWTPWQGVNVALVLISMPLVLGLAASGVRLALRG